MGYHLLSERIEPWEKPIYVYEASTFFYQIFQPFQSRNRRERIASTRFRGKNEATKHGLESLQSTPRNRNNWQMGSFRTKMF